MNGSTNVLCLCGHSPDAHAHYRPGSECVSCDAGACTRYRPVPSWRRWTARLRARVTAGSAAARTRLTAAKD